MAGPLASGHGRSRDIRTHTANRLAPITLLDHTVLSVSKADQVNASEYPLHSGIKMAAQLSVDSIDMPIWTRIKHGICVMDSFLLWTFSRSLFYFRAVLSASVV